MSDQHTADGPKRRGTWLAADERVVKETTTDKKWKALCFDPLCEIHNPKPATGSSGGKFTAWDGSLTPPSATKPATGEWTAEYVTELAMQRGNAPQNVADAHNAAIALKDEALQANRTYTEHVEQQLAAVEKEWERIISGHASTNQHIVDDKNKEIQQLREQLAAEREAREVAERSAKAWEEDAHRYATNAKDAKQQLAVMELELLRSNAKVAEKAQQLAAEIENVAFWKRKAGEEFDAHKAEREKVQTLVDALDAIDVAYQRVPDTAELRTCVFRGDFNELGDTIKDGRDALAKVKEWK